jgi:hypothetical protein
LDGEAEKAKCTDDCECRHIEKIKVFGWLWMTCTWFNIVKQISVNLYKDFQGRNCNDRDAPQSGASRTPTKDLPPDIKRINLAWRVSHWHMGIWYTQALERGLKLPCSQDICPTNQICLKRHKTFRLKPCRAANKLFGQQITHNYLANREATQERKHN